MQKRQVLINAVASVVQVLGSGVVLFLLYRFVIRAIGVETLGTWSLVLATASVANVAQLGLASAVVKFTAKYHALGDAHAVLNVVQTSVITLGLFIGALLVLLLPAARWALGIIMPGPSVEQAWDILPFALLSLWLSVLTAVYQSALDGLQRIDLKSMLLLGGSLLFLLLCILLVPSYGLRGLARAQVAQSFCLLLFSWLVLKRRIPDLPFIPVQWNRSVFREMIGYGANLQLISLMVILFEPMTKAFITRFGGLALTGYFEMANKMILQFRSLIISANQVLVPAIATMHETSPDLVRAAYRESYRLMIFAALPLYALLIGTAPLLSEFWVGHHERSFVLFIVVLSLGWLMNTLSAPAYFSNLGTGEVRWNMITHVVMSVINVVFGILLGALAGGQGAVLAAATALAISSMLLAVHYNRRHSIPLSELAPADHTGIAVCCCSGVVLTLLVYYRSSGRLSLSLLSSLMLAVLVLCTAVPLWLHPTRKRVVSWLERYLVTGTRD